MPLSLSLSLSHTHTYTHTLSLYLCQVLATLSVTAISAVFFSAALTPAFAGGAALIFGGLHTSVRLRPSRESIDQFKSSSNESTHTTVEGWLALVRIVTVRGRVAARQGLPHALE